MKPEMIGLIAVGVVLCGTLGISIFTTNVPDSDPCINPNMAQTKICYEPYDLPVPEPEPIPEPPKPTEPECINKLIVKLFTGDLLVYEGSLNCLHIDLYKNHPQFTVEYETGFRV